MTDNIYTGNRDMAGFIPRDTPLPKWTEVAEGIIQHVIVDNPDGSTSRGDGYKSTVNSTTVNLAAGATFEGTYEDALNYGGVRVLIYSSHDSAANGLEVWCSDDGVSGFIDDQYTIPAGKAKTFAATIAPYIKIRYTNGSTETTTLRICTLFLKHMSVVSSHRIQDNLNDDDDGQLVVSVPKYRTAQNTYVSGSATNSGNAKISIEEINGVVMPITRDDDPYNDAFSRLRVSNTDQRFDAEFIYDKQPLLFDEIKAGTGNATHNANSRDVTLETGGSGTGNYAGLYQHWYNPYTAGNSQLAIITGMLNSGNYAGTASVFLRSKVSGTVQEETIDQSSWIAATSGVNWNYSQIFIVDFQSLKVGRIRFALDRGGVIVPVATIENDNERAGGYWQQAHAPVYWKIYNTADATITEIGYGSDNNAVGFRFTTSAVQASQTMRAICCTVKSEGGGDLLDMAGIPFAVGNGATSRTVSTSLLPLLSIQLKTTFGAGTTRGLVMPTAFGFANDNPMYYELILNGTLTGASFASVSANSMVNYDVAASAISGGTVISAGYSSSGATKAYGARGVITNKMPLSVNYAGTTGDILSLCAIRFGAQNAAAGATIDWREVR